MVERQNGGGDGVAEEILSAVAQEPQSSLDGFGGAEQEGLLQEKPELLVGAVLVAGFLLARLVRRLGS